MHALARVARHAARRAPVVARANAVARCRVSRRWASSTTPYSTTQDPAEIEALQCLEKGTQQLEDGDVNGARAMYKRSVEIRPTAGALFNLGVAAYHLHEYQEAIDSWQQSIAIQPSADAHTNLASAYIISPTPRPDLAVKHLTRALELAPEDPEIMFNLAAVLEATGNLDAALDYYTQSKNHGIEKAEVHIRNVSTKIFGQRLREAEEKEQQSNKGGA